VRVPKRFALALAATGAAVGLMVGTHAGAVAAPRATFQPTWIACAGYTSDKYISYAQMSATDRQYDRACRHWLAIMDTHTEADR
jgi:hypothetical protein